MFKIRKKLYSMIATVVLVWANGKYQIGIEPDSMKLVVGLVVAYVIGQGVADHGKEKEIIRTAMVEKMESRLGHNTNEVAEKNL